MQYHDCGFFALRSPMLPRNQLTAAFHKFSVEKTEADSEKNEKEYIENKEGFTRFLCNLINDPVINEALWVASPGLVKRLGGKNSSRDMSKDEEMVATLYKYFIRMTSRCTPFGLFASCTYGHNSKVTQFESVETPKVNRVTRLDTEYIYRLVSTINGDQNMRGFLKYRTNTSLYQVGTRLHYIETWTRPDRPGIFYKLSAIDTNEYLLEVLKKAEIPETLDTLTESLCKNDPEIDKQEALRYVNDLIENQLLVPEITPSVTGHSPLRKIIHGLREAPPAQDLLNVLDSVDMSLAAIDSDGLGVDTNRYESIISALRELSPEVDEQRLFQVDVNAQFDVSLGKELVSDILSGVELLHMISPPRSEDRLDAFKREFCDRYEDLEVPLCEALDDDVGIGFDGSGSNASSLEPLLTNIRIFGSTGDSSSLGLSARDFILAEKVQELVRNESIELELDAKLIALLENKYRRPLPDAWGAFATILGTNHSDSNKSKVLLNSASGPGAANLIGRFCHLNTELEAAVKRCLKLEEELDPGAVYAEVAHMPEGRMGNVLRRPVLRDHEIVYLCESPIPEENRISVQDLLVSVREGQIVIKSRRTGKRIVPRLASAHNFLNHQNLNIYRFLCLLQQQGLQRAVFWDWGALDILDFLPRVTHRRLILSPASWKIHSEDIKSLIKLNGLPQFDAVQKVRERLALPQTILIAEGDNSVEFDLSCPLSVDIFCRHLRNYKMGIRIREVLSSHFGEPLKSKGETYANEVIIPFVRSAN